MRVYNLSAAHYAISNIELHRIKISKFSELNDPFELLGVNLRDKQKRLGIKKLKAKIEKEKGVICFSKSWKNPVLWSHYADKHRGICLGFDVEDTLLKKVTYEGNLMDLPSINSTWPVLEDRLIFTKYRDWKYEEEYRMVVGLTGKEPESNLYFYPFASTLELREVILGPLCDIPVEKIRKLVEPYSPEVHTIKARLAFTKYGVTENRMYRSVVEPN